MGGGKHWRELTSPFLFVKTQACFLACPGLPPALAAGHPTGPAHTSQPLSLSCHLPLHSRNEFLDTILPTHMLKCIVVKIFFKCFAGISH